MNPEEQMLHEQRRERVARVKRLLRWMPRKATLHRYPVLRRFQKEAMERAYIWSFRVNAAVPALYAGTILALLPLYGVQLILSVWLAFILRANLPILAGLQFITNPLTVLPIYYASFQIGRQVLNLIQIPTPQLSMAEMKTLLKLNDLAAVMDNLAYVSKVWLTTSLGSVILGTFLAAMAATAYKMGAREVTASYIRLRDLQRRRQARADAAAAFAKGAQEDPDTGGDSGPAR